MAEETIGNWTVSQMVRFIQDQLKRNPPSVIPTLTCDSAYVARKLVVSDEVQFTGSSISVGAAGSGSSLPATPEGYFKVLDAGGVVRHVPYYRAP